MDLMPHQQEGIRRIQNQPFIALFDEPRTRKSRQVIEGLQSKLATFVIVCPAQVKINWTDPDWGELKRWAWKPERFLVVSYEWLRTGKNLEKVFEALGKSEFALILDESSYIKNRQSKQWKACYGLRYGKLRIKTGRSYKWQQVRPPASRCVLLNGTPVSNNLSDLWSQFQVLDKTILDMTFWIFRSRYCVMGGFLGKQIVAHKNKEELMERLAPYTLTRSREGVFDDIPESYSEVVEVPLTEESWSVYKEMRDKLIVEIENDTTTAEQAGIKVLRLSQITSGFLGGFEGGATRDVSYEKRDWLFDWLREQNEPIVVWCWWRAEIDRLWAYEPSFRAEGWKFFKLLGGSDKAGVQSFHPDSASEKKVLLIAQPAAGGMGITLAKSRKQVYLSKNFSWLLREQSMERVFSPAHSCIETIDVLATGPNGQKTIDHQAHAAVLKKERLGEWCKDQWIKFLREA